MKIILDNPTEAFSAFLTRHDLAPTLSAPTAQRRTWAASLEPHIEIRRGLSLVSGVGYGDTPVQAATALALSCSTRTLVVDAARRTREEIQAPRLALTTACALEITRALALVDEVTA